jgi:hypothetical protein
MTHVFAYPWTLHAHDPAAVFDRLGTSGIDGVSVAAHYHSVQTLDPRGPGATFRQFPGGCFFDPPASWFAETPIDPPVNEVDGDRDAIGPILDAAADRGLDVGAWTVCMHNTRLGTENPEFRIQSSFGESHDHALCPSHPEVREYLAAVVGALADRDVSRIDLESLGYPGALHGHGRQFGHAKNHALSSATGRTLLSQCGCDACRDAAADHRVDFEAALEEVRSLCRDSLAAPADPHPEFEDLVEGSDHLRALFEFRASVVADLVDRLAAASGPTPLNYLVADGLGRGPTDGRPAGVDLSRLSGLDSVTALCYTEEAAVGRSRVERLRRTFDGSVHAAVTLDPAVTPGRRQFEATTAAVRESLSGALFVYNHSLMTDAHREWLADV